MKKKQKNIEHDCAHCENAEEIFGGEFCLCSKRGVVSPSDVCSKFVFDPLKVKVSVRKIPQFHPILPTEKEEQS